MIARAVAALACLLPLSAAPPAYGPQLEGFAYPWPVQRFAIAAAGEGATMSYMDVAPARPNGKAVVLLHGKNFCGATWEATARTLSRAGYRVLIPDQIGFCKSSKPADVQYSFALMADATRRLMASRGIDRAAVVGHSMGGMLATRFALMFPAATERLVLVNPLGLNDPVAEGMPYVGVPALLAAERRTDAASIRAYQLANYYHGEWRPEYDRWVDMQAGMYAGPGRETVALAQAKTSEMIATQPVAHELHRIQAATTLLIGMRDGTAFGRAQMPEARRDTVTEVPAAAEAAVRRFPCATLVRFADLGHSPQVEAPARFEAALLAALRAD